MDGGEGGGNLVDGVTTPLSEGTDALHEMFVTLVASGFTEWQACVVVGVHLAESGRQS